MHLPPDTDTRISKPVFQENKARQVFRKTNISYPLIRTPPFCLITDEFFMWAIARVAIAFYFISQ